MQKIIMVSYRDLLYREIQHHQFDAESLKGKPTTWLTGLPLILCGPILRKVHYNNVSVWLAFKEEVTDVVLEVFEASTTQVKQKVILSGTTNSLVKLGKNIYVTLVTAKGTTSTLLSDTIYGYTISFNHKGIQKHLDYKNVLKGQIKSISYHPYKYPTFCIPSRNTNNLKIVHGSCRKPHGGKTDALRALDTMLEINSSNVKERPQLLCLTGDQIYADDVADALLYKIIQAQKVLFGWEEHLPKNYPPVQLMPGNRKQIIGKTNKLAPDDLTTEDTKSHLIFLSEFILMYLFTFSDTFLSSNWPKFKEIYPGPFAGQVLKKMFTVYANEVKALKSFALSLPFVKKALANVSSIMIFDDHDITDDWFISKEWAEIALMKGTTSRRYILNGMLAYVLFQDWGNDFTKYLSSPGKKVLEALHMSSSYKYLNGRTEEIEEVLLPEVKSGREKNKPFFYLDNNLTWHHQIEYSFFKLVVLNTRTERQFYDVERPLGNLIKDCSAQLGKLPNDRLLIVVSATPVFGNILMEAGQEKLREGRWDQITGLGSRIKGLTGLYPKDQEAWSFSNLGFSKLLFLLSFCPKVLILSGEVHYSFTSYIRLWRKDSIKLSEIVQSTSSSLKNSTEHTHLPVTGIKDKKALKIIPYGLKVKANTPYKMIKVLGRKNFKETPLIKYKNPRFENLENLIFAGKLAIPAISLSPMLQFIVKYITSKSYNFLDPVFKKVLKTTQSKYFVDRGNQWPVPPTIVGKDNICLVSFTNHSIKSTIWLANGNWQKPDDSESRRLLFPFLKHEVQFNSKFKAEELPFNEAKRRLGRNVTVE